MFLKESDSINQNYKNKMDLLQVKKMKFYVDIKKAVDSCNQLRSNFIADDEYYTELSVANADGTDRKPRFGDGDYFGVLEYDL